MPQGMVENVGDKSIRELSHIPFANISEEEMDKTDERLGKIKVDIRI